MKDDWQNWLALTEFTANNGAHEKTNMSLFFTNYSFDLFFRTNLVLVRPDEVRHTMTVAQVLRNIHDSVRNEIL